MNFRMLSNVGGFPRGARVSAKDLDALGEGDTPFHKTLLDAGHVEKWDGPDEMPAAELVLGRDPIIDTGGAPVDDPDDAPKAGRRK